MRTTHSQLAVKWDGFRPVACSLSEQALSLTLNQTKPEGNQQPCEVSIATIADELEGKDFQIEDDLIRVRVTTPVGSFELRGLSFHLKVAVVILELQKEGIKPFASQWFWYDTDESDTSPTTRYSFFVIHKDKIVREEISFLDYSGSGFDPAAFDSGDDSDDDSPWQLAQAAYWYRQFYQEMKLGQLMVLRPDTPVLHYYPEGRPWLKLAGEPISSVALLGSIRTLLRLAIVLLALIAFLLIRR